jgi:hypothetical protein
VEDHYRDENKRKTCAPTHEEANATKRGNLPSSSSSDVTARRELNNPSNCDSLPCSRLPLYHGDWVLHKHHYAEYYISLVPALEKQ